MGKAAPSLIFIGVIWTAVGCAYTPVKVTEEDWIAAAQTSLAAVDRRQQSIIVTDESLSSPAKNALQHFRKTISIGELPDKEKFELPPGTYLRVRHFELSGGRFEFQSTSGPIPNTLGVIAV